MTLDLKNIRERLEAKRAELRNEAGTLDSQAHPAPVDYIEANEGLKDEADDAVDLEQIEKNRAILVNENALLMQVEEALKRLDNGTYGTCIICGKPIPEKRLEAIPWALLCVEDEEQLEARNLSIQDYLFEQSNMRDPYDQGKFSRDDLLL
ncbi:MAG TPA: TraR/DksA C4-type zinc finger protein [Ktedonobacteraceae bacterium]|nr:TraR/DksA C4-type zinc finger protein [Ktedonobacteraceae bacterium]